MKARLAACCLMCAMTVRVSTGGPAVDVATVVESVSATLSLVDTFQADADIYSST